MWQHVWTMSSIPEYSRFPLWARKGDTANTVQTLGQAVRMWTYYGKNWAILERRLQLTIWTLGQIVRTAKRNVRTCVQSLNLCWCRTPYLSWKRICKAFIKRALGMHYVQNSVLNSLSFDRVFRENWRSTSFQAVAGVCSTVRVKSILGVSPKVKESIKNPFRQEIWLGSVHDRLRVRVKGMTTA